MKKNLKILIIVFICGVVVLSCLCAAGKKKNKVNPVEQLEQLENGQIEVKEDSMLLKLDAVLAQMSERFTNEVTPVISSDKETFLAELNNVLADEANYPGGSDLAAGHFFLIDKKHKSVPEAYEPSDLVHLVQNQYYNISRNDLNLRAYAEEALVEMAKGARNDGITLLVSSTYRSWEYQKNLFQKWVRIDGLEEAERESAREGTSQHQLGVAIDFGSIDDSFIETSQGKWLDTHSEEYGWSLSFPKQYEDITGYRWECWHYRYIGIPACKLQNKWFNDVQQYLLEFIDAWKNYQE